jgi:chromosome segregation ATPase
VLSQIANASFHHSDFDDEDDSPQDHKPSSSSSGKSSLAVSLTSSSRDHSRSPAQSKQSSSSRSPVRGGDQDSESPDASIAKLNKKNNKEISRLEDMHKERMERLKRQCDIEKKDLEDEMHRKRKEHQEELERLDQELRAKRKMQSGKDSDNLFALETKISSLDKDCEKWRNLYTEATEKLAANESVISKQKLEISTLKDELSKAEESFLRQLKDSKDRLQSALEDKENLERQVKELKSLSLSASSSAIASGAGSVEELERTVGIMKTEERKLRTELADLRDQLDAATETTRRAQRVEESLKRDVSTLEALQADKLSRKDKAMQEVKDELDAANNLLRERKKKIDEQSMFISTLETEKAALERQIKVSVPDAATLSSSSQDSLLAQYTEAEQTIFSMKLEEKRLRTNLAETQDKLENAQESIKRAQRAEESLKRDMTTLESLHSDKMARKDKTLQELRDDLDAANVLSAKHKKELDTASQEVFKLNEQMKVLEQLSRSAQLASKAEEDTSKQLIDTRNELQQLKRTVGELTEELNESRQQLMVKIATLQSTQADLEEARGTKTRSVLTSNPSSMSLTNSSGVHQELLEATEKQLEDARSKIKTVCSYLALCFWTVQLIFVFSKAEY